MEYHGSTQAEAFETIKEKLRENTARVLDEAGRRGILPREAAINLAVDRIRKAVTVRRWSLFSWAPQFL